MADGPSLVSVQVGDRPEPWTIAGFRVVDGRAFAGEVTIDLGEGAPGISSWTLRGVDAGPIDGLDTRAEDEPPRRPTILNPNGVVALDHIVVTSHDVGRTAGALVERGFEVRRRWRNEGRLYTFFRAGDTVVELLGPEEPDGSDGPARLYGLAFTVADIDATAAQLGPLLGRVKDAVQPGRKIATLRREAGLSVPVAFMSPG